MEQHATEYYPPLHSSSRPASRFHLLPIPTSGQVPPGSLSEEQVKSKNAKAGQTACRRGRGLRHSPTPTGLTTEIQQDIEDRIRKILQDGRKFVNADDTDSSDEPANVSMTDLSSGIAEGFTPQNSYHVRLIAPQIQLQSDKNKKHVVLIAAKGMELKVVEVPGQGPDVPTTSAGSCNDASSSIWTALQFFVTHQKWFSGQLVSIYSGNNYGMPLGVIVATVGVRWRSCMTSKRIRSASGASCRRHRPCSATTSTTHCV